MSVGQLSSVVETVAAVETDVLDGHFRLALLPVVGVVIKLRSSVLAEPVRAHATQPWALQSFVMEQLLNILRFFLTGDLLSQN